MPRARCKSPLTASCSSGLAETWRPAKRTVVAALVRSRASRRDLTPVRDCQQAGLRDAFRSLTRGACRHRFEGSEMVQFRVPLRVGTKFAAAPLAVSALLMFAPMTQAYTQDRRVASETT